MRRRLAVLNVILVAAAVAGLWRFRVEYQRARQRYDILRAIPKTAAKPEPLPAPATEPPAQAANYLDAAAKYLFSPDRNPTVVVEAPKVKPRPELPQLHGVMNLGGGPIAIMSTERGSQRKTLRLGESIGEFKFLAASADKITLEWEGEKIEAQVSDLLVRGGPEPGAAAAGGSGPAAPQTTGSGAAPAAPAASSATVLKPINPGGEYQIGPVIEGGPGNTYYSLPGDTAPAGTVYQGKRKVVRNTPFGQQTWWEDVK